MRGGDAATSRGRARPAKRHAAQSIRLITSAEGPMDTSELSGRSSTPLGGSTSSAITHPRTFRPASGMRTIDPMRTSASR
jgi:hypothetical protein